MFEVFDIDIGLWPTIIGFFGLFILSQIVFPILAKRGEDKNNYRMESRGCMGMVISLFLLVFLFEKGVFYFTLFFVPFALIVFLIVHITDQNKKANKSENNPNIVQKDANEKTEIGLKRMVCPICLGTGKGPYNSICPTCLGSGKYEIK